MLKRFTYRLATVLALLSTALVLQGCVTAAIVGGAAVATKVATDPRSTGRQIDDETLEEKVAYNLNRDAQLREEARINVVAYNGKILLIGQAPSDYVKDQARNITAGVNGVAHVYNEIRIGQKIGVTQIGQDSWITTKIKSQLLANAQVKATEVKVITENGEVFLMGKLSNAQINAASNVAKHTRGVVRVVKVVDYAE